ncbi:BRCA1 protein, partial [Pycnonotus jocosus]|nr:BRCA1 protein [Pycnonotus jocosus]
MDLSVITIGQVQNVLSAMQKNLECPICLDVVQEPVSTKCDHIFCRFCMFKLISKKKKGVVECPLCKTEVTKRSLKENSRFKQLIEGLLETIRAFELDTGVKFLKSHHFPKTSTEATAAESLCKESSVIQSKGFRNRRKSAKGNGQENFTLEASVNTDAKMCRPRNKPQKSDSQKGSYIVFGSESSEEFFKQPSKTGFEDKGVVQISSQVRLEELESAEEGNENSCNAQPDKLCAKEITLPNVRGESDFSKECLSKKSTQSIAECAKPDQVNVTECQSSPLNVLAGDLLPEQCDRIGDASPTVNEDTSFFKNTEEMDEQQTQYNSENQGFGLGDSSESRLDQSKEMDTDVQSVGAVEACEPENDSSHDKELPLEKLPQPETLHSANPNKVSKKRLKQSIQKVNEWFSKSNEILSSGSSLDESAASADVSGEGDLCLSDKESCISEKTDPMVDSMEIAAVEGKKKWSKKQTAENIKDKIFGKTYMRGRKSNPPPILSDVLPTRRKEDVAADKCLNNFSKNRIKRKRKSASVLQPEDFIKKRDTNEADGGPQSVNNEGLGDAEKKRCDESVAVNENHLSQNRANNALTEPEEGGESTWKKATEKVTTKDCDGEPEIYNCDQKSTKKRNSAAKRSRHSSRTMCALQLVVDRSSVFPDPAEPQIDSYPSSGEPRKADPEQNPVRRSRRLQLLSEEMTKQTKKGVKGARKNNSDHGRSVSGDQRNVAAHSAECKDLCEPQNELSDRPVTNLERGDLEANELQVSVKNLSNTVETGRRLFSPSCQPSNCGSTAPDTGSQDSEIRGSPLLLQLPSVSAGQTAQQTEEVAESPTAFPQEHGHDSQNVPGDFKTEKLPVAKNVLELTKEAEDSDLDTQYLRNIFRHPKRSSFSLFQTARQARAVEDSASETLNLSCAAQVENKANKQLQPESLQEEKAQNLSRVSEKEKLKTRESACVDPVPCLAVSTGEHWDDISQAAEEGTLTPARTETAQSEHQNGLLQEEQGNEKPVSDEIGIESELRQNPSESDGSQSDQSNTEKHDSRQNDLNTGQEISFSSESNQAGKTEVVACRGPVPHFQSTSMICPATCQQRPAEFSCEVTRTKSSKRERKCAKGDEEQAAQTVSTAMPKCSAEGALEEPLGENCDLTGLSETPNGLLCSDTDLEENTSLCETDRKEQSAVFVKSDNALGKELHNRNARSKPRSRSTQKSRRRVQKLPSSDEESCEDEELPCFQTLIFSKSASTPLQTDKQMTSVVESPMVECPVSPSMLPHCVSSDDNVQKVPEAAPNNVCVSPSQESECSVNLFSSQSNMSEESLNGAQEPKQHLPQAHVSKQMSNVDDSKETSQNCSGGLKTDKDECQKDPDMGANLGEASGYDSEISIVEDSCGPFSQAEILTTQQKNAMQNSLKKLQQEMAALEAVLKQNGSQSCEGFPVHRELPHSSTEGASEMDQKRNEENRSIEQKSRTRQNSASLSSDLFGNVTQGTDNSSSSVRLFTPQTEEATDEAVTAQITDKSSGPGHKLKTSECFPVPVLHNATGKENAASKVVTKRKEMSLVASGLNHNEHLVVQKFVKKTQSTLSNHITEGTTHVIMKTDDELVCERTLKYFLGIAGGKWVVSYQWIIQSFKEGRILNEENFEVRGDVINGRNHQGPKRARQALTEKIFKDFEICCCGPFTDMTTEHLQWMVELCGASVVKQPDLFSHTADSTAVVVVQPDAWKENVDYRAIQQCSNVAVVTREWVLDSVACYECQELSAYLIS